MPLTKRQFELRIDEEMESWMRQAYSLLKDHPDLAYSVDELGDAILGNPFHVTQKFQNALDALARISAVEKRDVSGTDYYAFLHEFDTNTWEPDLSSWKV